MKSHTVAALVLMVALAPGQPAFAQLGSGTAWADVESDGISLDSIQAP